MTGRPDLLTVAQAAAELGVGPSAIRDAISRGAITPVRIDGRTNMLTRAEVERYRRQSLGRPGRRKTKPQQPAN